MLAASGLAASAALIVRMPQSRRWPASTIGQVALVAAGMAVRGPAVVTGWMAAAEPVDAVPVTGEPTPLAHVPVPMVLGALLLRALASIGGPGARLAGRDAALRVTAGSAVVGAAQALVLAPAVAASEEHERRTYFRLPGSRLGTGTRLGYTER